MAFDPASARPETSGFDAASARLVNEATGSDRAQAVASGVNRGALVNLAGLPVTTALNLLDLAKIPVGVGYSAITGKPVPDMLTPADRSQYIGAPEWIAQKIEGAGGTRVINPNRPDDEASRLLHAGGQGAGMVLFAPQSAGQAATNALLAAGSTAASQYAADKGASPAVQTAAGLALPLTATAVASRARAANTRAQQKAVDQQVRRENFAETRGEGFVYPPSQTNPSILNKVLGGFSGKAATDQAVAVKNQPLVAQLARRDLQLPPDVPLAEATFPMLRKNAAAAGYDPVRNFGVIVPNRNYYTTVKAIKHQYETGAGTFDKLRVPEAEGLLDNALSNNVRFGFDSNEAVSMILRLREDASASYRTGTAAAIQTAKVQRGLANALEDLVGDNLQTAGQTTALRNFREARQLIAKSFNYEEAFDPANGVIDARKMFSQWKNGEPLTGDALTIAKHGGLAGNAANPKAATQTPPGMSVADAFAAMLSGGTAAALTGQPAATAAGMAWPVARMATRAGVLSGPYQNWMAQPPKGGPSLSGQALARIGPTQSAIPLLTAELADLMRSRSSLPYEAQARSGLFGLLPQGQ